MTPTNARGLSALPIKEAEVIGYKILRSYDRMGFTHKEEDGSVRGIRFRAAHLVGDEMASYTIDTETLWLPTDNLVDPKIIHTLSDVLEKTVWTTRRPLTVVVELKPRPKVCAVRLPTRVPLDLGNLPIGELLVPIGIGGEGAVQLTLPQMGHTLLVGATGAGKSMFVHAALSALLKANGPDLLRLVLIDPKRNELTPWQGVPHLLEGIATTPDQAEKALANAAAEVDRRGDVLGRAGMRDITAYNKKRAGDLLLFILVAIDETIDLTLQAGDRSRVADYLKIIATRGRSAGVILWCATQHAAAVSGLPRVVNVNLASRLVFRVNDRSAAQVAGCPGAQDIPRNRPGRMLAKLDGPPMELQGYCLSDEAVGKLVQDLRRSGGGPTISDFERQLVRFAWENLRGAFTVNELAKVFHRGNGTINDMATRWEQMGWLTPQNGRNGSRRVTETLLRVAGLRPAAPAETRDTGGI
ncbi:MAG: DNA translocase FtsK [Thermoflexales bacterium]|nr:DNA translocase FtsK [Thermoflexales bacterium]